MIDRTKHWPIRHWGGHWAIGHWPRLERVVEYVRSLVLYHSPAVIVRKLFVDRVAGSYPSSGSGWPVFVSHLPDGTGFDDAICLYDTWPHVDGELPDGQLVEHKAVRVTVRARQYRLGLSKLNELLWTLDGLVNEQLTLGVWNYLVASAALRFFRFDGYDSRRRYLFTVEYESCMYRMVEA